jgi:hypothetical protein
MRASSTRLTKQASNLSLPSSIIVLNTNISIPLLSSLSDARSYNTSFSATFYKTIFAFYIIVLASSFLTAVLSLLSVVLATSRTLSYLLLTYSSLGAVFALAASALATAVVALIEELVNKFGDSVGLRVRDGTVILVLTWVSFRLQFGVIVYWVWCGLLSIDGGHSRGE